MAKLWFRNSEGNEREIAEAQTLDRQAHDVDKSQQERGRGVDDEEEMHRQDLAALKAEQGIVDNEFYHYDTPLTVAHETKALLNAGFSSVEVLKNWGATYTIKAIK